MIDPIISECSKLAQKEYKTWYDEMGKWSTGIVQEIEIWPYCQMV